MKSLLLASAFALVAATSAAAAPVLLFDVAGAPASSVSATVTSSDCDPLFPCSVSTQLDAELDSRIFALAAGESETFDFFDISVFGIGAGEGSVSATLAFDSPLGVSATGEGEGAFFTFLGIISGGVLSWSDVPAIILADGSSFSVDFSDFAGFGFGNTATITATVSALAVAGENEVPVPAPGALGLLGLGLLGLGLRRRVYSAASR
jgi:hypothetical protein